MSQKKMNRRYCGCFQLLDVGEGNQNVLPDLQNPRIFLCRYDSVLHLCRPCQVRCSDVFGCCGLQSGNGNGGTIWLETSLVS